MFKRFASSGGVICCAGAMFRGQVEAAFGWLSFSTEPCRSGGMRIRSLTNRLNVPVVRNKRPRSAPQGEETRTPEVLEYKFKRSHNISHVSASARRGGLPSFCREISGFKREFDPGSESTLAACLTHASRTRKSPQGDEYSGARVSN